VPTGQSNAPAAMLQGVYVGAADPTGVAAFAATTGTSVQVASDYLPTDSGWSGLDGANNSLSWLTGAWHGTGYILSLGVPMFPSGQGSLSQGAAGAYNQYFVTLAQTLVSAGEANSYLRLGWEFDGDWYSWSATSPGDEANYAAYFRQIVTAMRSVPGEAFRFVWNPDATAFTTAGYSPAAAFPGAAYVDDIGIDVYDQAWVSPLTPANAWTGATLPSLQAALSFAQGQGKPLVVAEWGVANRPDGHGLNDDPMFVNNMSNWMHAAGVAYESLFDFNDLTDGGDTNAFLTGGMFPASLAAFKADF
jgi:hypothetical protein